MLACVSVSSAKGSSCVAGWACSCTGSSGTGLELTAPVAIMSPDRLAGALCRAACDEAGLRCSIVWSGQTGCRLGRVSDKGVAPTWAIAAAAVVGSPASCSRPCTCCVRWSSCLRRLSATAACLSCDTHHVNSLSLLGTSSKASTCTPCAEALQLSLRPRLPLLYFLQLQVSASAQVQQI